MSANNHPNRPVLSLRLTDLSSDVVSIDTLHNAKRFMDLPEEPNVVFAQENDSDLENLFEFCDATDLFERRVRWENLWNPDLKTNFWVAIDGAKASTRQSVLSATEEAVPHVAMQYSTKMMLQPESMGDVLELIRGGSSLAKRNCAKFLLTEQADHGKAYPENYRMLKHELAKAEFVAAPPNSDNNFFTWLAYSDQSEVVCPAENADQATHEVVLVFRINSNIDRLVIELGRETVEGIIAETITWCVRTALSSGCVCIVPTSYLVEESLGSTSVHITYLPIATLGDATPGRDPYWQVTGYVSPTMFFKHKTKADDAAGHSFWDDNSMKMEGVVPIKVGTYYMQDSEELGEPSMIDLENWTYDVLEGLSDMIDMGIGLDFECCECGFVASAAEIKTFDRLTLSGVDASKLNWSTPQCFSCLQKSVELRKESKTVWYVVHRDAARNATTSVSSFDGAIRIDFMEHVVVLHPKDNGANPRYITPQGISAQPVFGHSRMVDGTLKLSLTTYVNNKSATYQAMVSPALIENSMMLNAATDPSLVRMYRQKLFHYSKGDVLSV